MTWLVDMECEPDMSSEKIGDSTAISFSSSSTPLDAISDWTLCAKGKHDTS